MHRAQRRNFRAGQRECARKERPKAGVAHQGRQMRTQFITNGKDRRSLLPGRLFASRVIRHDALGEIPHFWSCSAHWKTRSLGSIRKDAIQSTGSDTSRVRRPLTTVDTSCSCIGPIRPSINHYGPKDIRCSPDKLFLKFLSKKAGNTPSGAGGGVTELVRDRQKMFVFEVRVSPVRAIQSENVGRCRRGV